MSDDYEVGYGKPPKHTQFEPGKSGNPRGRPRGARGLKTDLLAELSARHTIQINGKAQRGNRQQLMVRTLTARAASGDLKAQALLLPLVERVFGIEDRGDARERLSKQDEALLAELLAAGAPEQRGDVDAERNAELIPDSVISGSPPLVTRAGDPEPGAQGAEADSSDESPKNLRADDFDMQNHGDCWSDPQDKSGG